MGRVVVRCLLAAGMWVACAQAWANVPAQFEVVERFAGRLSDGNLMQLQEMLSAEVVLSEHDLFVRVAVGSAARQRFRAWIAEGARLEVSFESASADGALIVTREEMWLDGMPEIMLPVRSTSVYVVDGGRVHGITRVMVADQRDALMREAVVGEWRLGVDVLSYRADGSYEVTASGRAWDSGAYTIEGGVARFASNDQTGRCEPGDVGVWWLYFADPDRHTLEKIEDSCRARGGGRLRWLRVIE